MPLRPLPARPLALLLAALVAAPAALANHTPPPGGDGPARQLVGWSYAHAPALATDFLAKHHELFEGLNWTDPAAAEAAGAAMATWSQGQMAALAQQLDPSQAPGVLFTNFTRLAIPGFAPPGCPVSPQGANPLLLDVKLTSLYEALDLADGSLSYLTPEGAALPIAYKKAVVYAIECMLEAVTHLDLAYASLNETERADLLAGESRFMDILEVLQEAPPEDLSWMLRQLTLLGRVDAARVANATALLIEAAEGVRGLLGAGGTVPLTRVDQQRFVVVGSDGADEHTEWAVLLLEPDGADTYRNNAGGANALAPRTVCTNDTTRVCAVALVVDAGGDDDKYWPDERKSPTIGSGSLGVGVLLDDAGNDDYRGPRHMGSSNLAGAGALLDLAGADTYDTTYPFEGENRPGLGGGSTGGSGFLYDGGGADSFRHDGADAMGWGGGAGRGLLVNAGLDADTYVIVEGHVGGVGVTRGGPGLALGELAGLGILVDAGGHDTYRCETHVNYGCMGSAAVAGLGALLDLGGDDLYELGTPACCIASRLNFSMGLGGASAGGVGILYDPAGADRYTDETRAGGFGACAAVGLLLDAQGVDAYVTGQGKSFGYGHVGCDSVESCNGQDHSLPPELVKLLPCIYMELGVQAVGILRDEGLGADSYQAPAPLLCGTRGNDRVWLDGSAGAGNQTGIGLDGTLAAGCT